MVFLSLGDELKQRGYSHKRVVIHDENLGAFTSPNGKLTIYCGMRWKYPFVSYDARTISRDKVASHDIAKAQGVPVPKTCIADDFEQAAAFLHEYGRVIVKPSEGNASKGLTRDIVDESMLEKALTDCSGHSGVTLIQEQFIGEEVRFTIVSGKVRSALIKQKLAVIGDGHHSVEDLITSENSTRTNLPHTRLVYPSINPSMITEDISLEYVPARGERVELGKSTLVSEGASLSELIDSIHPSYIDIAERLAAALNPAFIVVDLMIKDYMVMAESGNHVFLEYNTAPVLSMYGSAREGCPQNIASLLADLIDEFAH